MIGRTLGHYRVLEKLGEGGMGEVFRARDEVLGRDVAIKVLPEEVSEDPERLSRFEREAKVLATLNHPHIGAIYGLEEDSGRRFLVLELVEGETVAERLYKGPMPVVEAVPLAIQMARALEAAHERGIVHRDLKPANLKITPDGDMKVLDFGLAKPNEATFQGDMTESPTLTYVPTGAKVLMGTAAYMSPEQVRGEEADKRSDIWAFGVVLWEMLTGTKLFEGNTVSDVLASTLMSAPDWEGLPEGMPAGVRRVLRHCLVQDSKSRLHDIADARIELEELLEAPEIDEEVAPPPPRPLWQRALPWLAVPLALVAGWLLRPIAEPEPLPVVRFEIPLPEGERLTHVYRHSLDISPDGRAIAFVSGTLLEGGYGLPERAQLRLRHLDRGASEPIPGTDYAAQPVFSPDGQWIAMITRDGNTRLLKKVPVDGGEAVTICECDAEFGVTWGTDGSIVFAGYYSGLYRVSELGGDPEILTELDEGSQETSHRLPHWIPGTDSLLFTAVRHGALVYPSRNLEIRLLDLEDRSQQALIQGGADARFVPTGHLVFVKAGGLMAVPFDRESLDVAGSEVPVLERVHQSIHMNSDIFETLAAQVAMSSRGTLAYVESEGMPEVPSDVQLVDREGNAESVGIEPKALWVGRALDDGQRVLFGTPSPPWDLWSIDIERKTVTRQTFVGSVGMYALGPEQGQVTFVTFQDDRDRIVWKSLDTGPGGLTVLDTDLPPGFLMPSDWSPDGEHLAVVIDPRGGETRQDIWIAHREGTLQPFLDTPFYEGFPDFSPDGHWIAYVSGESGRLEVYVRPFPGPGPAVQISADGGTAPAWSPDGREITFRRGDFQSFTAVSIDTSEGRIKAGRPIQLFEGNYDYTGPVRSYDIMPDGRFLLVPLDPEAIMAALEEFNPTKIRVVQNWTSELLQKVPR